MSGRARKETESKPRSFREVARTAIEKTKLVGNSLNS